LAGHDFFGGDELVGGNGHAGHHDVFGDSCAEECASTRVEVTRKRAIREEKGDDNGNLKRFPPISAQKTRCDDNLRRR
jgi:hypothetical protein